QKHRQTSTHTQIQTQTHTQTQNTHTLPPAHKQKHKHTHTHSHTHTHTHTAIHIHIHTQPHVLPVTACIDRVSSIYRYKGVQRTYESVYVCERVCWCGFMHKCKLYCKM